MPAAYLNHTLKRTAKSGGHGSNESVVEAVIEKKRVAPHSHGNRSGLNISMVFAIIALSVVNLASS